MVSSAELQLLNDNSQPENDKDASGGDSPKVSGGPGLRESSGLPIQILDINLAINPGLGSEGNRSEDFSRAGCSQQRC